MRAIWNNAVIAQSADTVVVEGNHYFPPEALDRQYFVASTHHSYCGWKGEASYYDVLVNGELNRNAAWHYPAPKAAAQHIAGRVAFWHGVKIEP